jgi:hypothetical protein
LKRRSKRAIAKSRDMICDTTLVLLGAKVVCLVIGSLLGFVAACIWFVASTAKVTTEDDRYYVGGDLRGNPDSKGQRIYVVSTANKQSKFNKIAAIFTGLAALLQALAVILSLCS